MERPGIPPDNTGSGPKPNETHHGYDFQRRIVPWVSYPAISGNARGPEKREQERQSSSQNSCLGRSREKPHAQQAPRGRKPARLGQGSECGLTAFLYLPTNSCGSRFSTSGLSCKTEPNRQGGKHGISDPKSLSTETSEDTQGREKSEGTAGNPESEPMLRGLLGPLNPSSSLIRAARTLQSPTSVSPPWPPAGPIPTQAEASQRQPSVTCTPGPCPRSPLASHLGTWPPQRVPRKQEVVIS